MNTIFINTLNDRVVQLTKDLLEYEKLVEADVKREGTGKVYPENKDAHIQLQHSTEALKSQIMWNTSTLRKYL